MWLPEHSSASIGRASVREGAVSASTDGELPVRFVESLGIMGHELRNALSCIRGATAVMRARQLGSEEERRWLAMIDRATRRMGEIVSTSLECARVGREAVVVNAELMDLRALCEEVIEEALAAHSTAIRLEPGEAAWGSWDRVALAQVMSNLLRNAAVHGGTDEPIEVEISLSPETAAVSVTNRGTTIPRELIPSLFEPFHRGFGPGRGSDQGLGLGLFVVHRLVKAHRGAISVHSSVERGTSFTVELPRRP
jgi:signal transduction histidine kinase